MCGKCGGNIEECELDDPKVVNKAVPTDKQLFACALCHQPYWWNPKESSRSSRALMLADKLFTYIQNGLGKPLYEKVQRDSSGNVTSTEMDDHLVFESVAVDESKDESLINFVSAHMSYFKTEPLFTNLNDDFRG